MSAVDHLSDLQFVLQHKTSTSNRDSIAENGLMMSKSHGLAGRYGVFLSGTSPRQEGPDPVTSDIWSVDTRGLKLHKDTIGGHDPGHDFYTQQDVEPSRMRLLHPGTHKVTLDQDYKPVYTEIPKP